jgi:hypothetical protein
MGAGFILITNSGYEAHARKNHEPHIIFIRVVRGLIFLWYL